MVTSASSLEGQMLHTQYQVVSGGVMDVKMDADGHMPVITSVRCYPLKRVRCSPLSTEW